MKAHHKGIHEAFLVKRRIKVVNLQEHGTSRLKDDLEKQKGIDWVSLDRRDVIIVHYDASCCSLDELIPIIAQHGCHLDTNIGSRIRNGWYRFTDNNIHENARHKGACCSKPPK